MHTSADMLAQTTIDWVIVPAERSAASIKQCVAETNVQILLAWCESLTCSVNRVCSSHPPILAVSSSLIMHTCATPEPNTPTPTPAAACSNTVGRAIPSDAAAAAAAATGCSLPTDRV